VVPASTSLTVTAAVPIVRAPDSGLTGGGDEQPATAPMAANAATAEMMRMV
jgi:hypothetical protein